MQDVACLYLVALGLLFNYHIDRAAVGIHRVSRSTTQFVTPLRRYRWRVELVEIERTVILVDFLRGFLAKCQILFALRKVLMLQVHLKHNEVEQLHLEEALTDVFSSRPCDGIDALQVLLANK